MQDLDPSDICKKKFLNPLKKNRVIIRTPTHGRTDGRTDRQTDRQTDGRTGWIQYTPPKLRCGGYNYGLYIILQLVNYPAAFRVIFRSKSQLQLCKAISYITAWVKIIWAKCVWYSCDRTDLQRLIIFSYHNDVMIWHRFVVSLSLCEGGAELSLCFSY